MKYWGHCVFAATYLINRVPSSVLNYETPYERLYDTKPLLSHLRTIGYLCFAKNLSEHDKMMPRSKPPVHMGYSAMQKGYILFDMTTKSFFVSRDVIFREDMFTFKQEMVHDRHSLFRDTLQVSDMWCSELTTLEHASNSSDAVAQDPISGSQSLKDTNDNSSAGINPSDFHGSINPSIGDPILQELDPTAPIAN